jgi:hypothetical protein
LKEIKVGDILKLSRTFIRIIEEDGDFFHYKYIAGTDISPKTEFRILKSYFDSSMIPTELELALV